MVHPVPHGEFAEFRRFFARAPGLGRVGVHCFQGECFTLRGEALHAERVCPNLIHPPGGFDRGRT